MKYLSIDVEIPSSATLPESIQLVAPSNNMFNIGTFTSVDSLPNRYREQLSIDDEHGILVYKPNKSTGAWLETNAADAILCKSIDPYSLEEYLISMVFRRYDPTDNRYFYANKYFASSLLYTISVQEEELPPAPGRSFTSNTEALIDKDSTIVPASWETTIKHISYQGVDNSVKLQQNLLDEEGNFAFRNLVEIHTLSNFFAKPIIIKIGTSLLPLIFDLGTFNDFSSIQVIEIIPLRTPRLGIVRLFNPQKNDFNPDFGSDYKFDATTIGELDYINNDFGSDTPHMLQYKSLISDYVWPFNNDFSRDFEKNEPPIIEFIPDYSTEYWNEEGAEDIYLYTMESRSVISQALIYIRR